MPRPIATDTTKAIEIRPILLNFMRFLNPRPAVVFNRFELRATLWGCESFGYCRSYRDFVPLYGPRDSGAKVTARWLPAKLPVALEYVVKGPIVLPLLSIS